MVFSFDRKATKESDRNINRDVAQKLKKVIRGLKSMNGIPDENLPSFKFFNFKKSTSFGASTEEAKDDSVRSADGKVLLTMNDISYKILADQGKKEQDMISLVTSAASQELEKPLQQMLLWNNLQAKILYRTLNQANMSPEFKDMLVHVKSLTDD